jgi:hypothetical protein
MCLQSRLLPLSVLCCSLIDTHPSTMWLMAVAMGRRDIATLFGTRVGQGVVDKFVRTTGKH